MIEVRGINPDSLETIWIELMVIMGINYESIQT